MKKQIKKAKKAEPKTKRVYSNKKDTEFPAKAEKLIDKLKKDLGFSGDDVFVLIARKHKSAEKGLAVAYGEGDEVMAGLNHVMKDVRMAMLRGLLGELSSALEKKGK